MIEEPQGKYYMSRSIEKVDCSQHADTFFAAGMIEKEIEACLSFGREKKQKQILLINCMVLFNRLLRDWTKFKPNPLNWDFWGRSHVGMTGTRIGP